MMFGAAPSQHPTDRGGDARALRCRLELRHRLTLRRKAGRKEPLVRVAGNDPPAVARQFVGEALGVTDAEDLCSRVMAETPGWKGDRARCDFSWALRHADDHPADLARAYRGQLPGD
jgi:hypothetical protein